MIYFNAIFVGLQTELAAKLPSYHGPRQAGEKIPMDGVKTLLALVHHHLFLGTCLSRCIEESDNLPDPDVLAQEIVEDVEAEHEQFHRNRR